MKNPKFKFLEFFPSFQNRDEYFERLLKEERPFKKIISLYTLLICFSLFYGIVMGSYHGFLQAITSGIKVPVLFTLVLLICFPAFYIIQFILGSKLQIYQMICIILAGFVLTTAIMISFAPIVVFFLLTGSNYYFLQLLHISIFILSGILGMKTIVDALKFSCEKKNVYPQVGVVVFRFWIIILAFVGIQFAWNLRPFLGDRDQPFKLFRQYEGNFYTAIIYSIRQLSGSDNKDLKRNNCILNKQKSNTSSMDNRNQQDSVMQLYKDLPE
jgi:hypothetical protein